jgi:hypothetical protein
MAKSIGGRKREGNGPAGTKATPDNRNDGARKGGDTVAGYFRRVFAENPKLLKGRSNDEVLRRWLADHPGHATVPQSVKNSLSNIKSVLRQRRRKRKAARPAPEGGGAEAQQAQAAKRTVSPRNLESLEEQIDECLTLAKRLDREGLADVIHMLRRARNQVVWKLGE